MNKAESKELSVAAQFHELDRQLALSKCCFSLYQSITLDTSSLKKEEYEKLMLNYQQLIIAERSILSQALFVQLHKFFDSQRKAIQVEKIISRIENDADRQLVQEKYKNLISEHTDVIKKLRNKTYAHTDKNSLPEDLFENIKTTYTDLKQIIEEIEEIMEKLSHFLNVSRRTTNVNDEDAQIQQLDMIRLAIKDYL